MTKAEIVQQEDIEYQEAATPATTHEPAMTLFGTDDPVEFVEKAERTAGALTGIIEKRKLYSNISGKRHVRVEGWTTLGSMVGVFPVVTWTRKLENGWEARVEARTRAGEIVGAAEAECLRSEKRWKDADDYALRSMAQTRATSKALRLPLGFLVQLAGFDATPAEEIPDGGFGGSSAPDNDYECPACGSAVWDNREKRATGWKGPAWRCKNRDCNGIDEDGVNVSEGKKPNEPWVTWKDNYFSPTSAATFDEALSMAGIAEIPDPGTAEWEALEKLGRNYLMSQAGGDRKLAADAWAAALAEADLAAGEEPPPELFPQLVANASEAAAATRAQEALEREPFDDGSYGGYHDSPY